jgi:hypothetical protein
MQFAYSVVVNKSCCVPAAYFEKSSRVKVARGVVSQKAKMCGRTASYKLDKTINRRKHSFTILVKVTYVTSGVGLALWNVSVDLCLRHRLQVS